MEDLFDLESPAGFGPVFPTSPGLALKAGLAAWRRAAAPYRADPGPRRFRQKLRWALAAALRPGTALTWFAAMDSPLLAPFHQENPLLAFKPLRTYLSVRWDPGRRAKVILDTCRFAAARGGAVARALTGPAGLRLAGTPLKGLGEAEVRLGRDPRFRKEGELVLELRCEALGGPLAALSFALERGPGGTWTFLAGCVQGGDSGQQESVRRLTRAMHGLRPKAMMVFLAQEAARALGASRLLGAGSGIQVHQRKHLIHIPWIHGLSFDYDALWAESGGRAGSDGWSELPLRACRRDLETVKSGKKSMYAKRYKMLDELSAQLGRALGPG